MKQTDYSMELCEVVRWCGVVRWLSGSGDRHICDLQTWNSEFPPPGGTRNRAPYMAKHTFRLYFL